MKLPHLDQVFARSERRRGRRGRTSDLQTFRLKFATIARLKRIARVHNISKTRQVELALAAWKP